jgi:hypothetical protein
MSDHMEAKLYGDQGRGVCLVFDKARLVESLSPVLAGLGSHSRSGAVRYANEPLWRDTYLNLQIIRLGGRDALVNDTAAEHMEALFFTKLTDWTSEHEYRFVVATDSVDPINVSVADSLTSVVMGYEWAPQFLPSLKDLCTGTHVTIRQLRWFNAEPRLEGISID